MPTTRINAKYKSAQARKHRIDETQAEAADTTKDYVDQSPMKRAAPSTSIHPLATPCPQRRPRDCRLAGIRPTCRVRRLRDRERNAATELLTATRIPPNEASGSFRETGTVNADCEPRSVDQRDPARER
jgi:hypothetical protein